MGEVRLSPPITILSLVALAMAALSLGQHRSAVSGDVRCKVAAAYLEDALTTGYLAVRHEKVVVSVEPESMMTLGNPVDIARLKNGNPTPEARKHPLFALYEQAALQDGQSAIKLCPEVRALMRRSDIAPRIAGDERIANPRDKDGIYKYPIISISMPAVDASKGEAIMFASQVSALLGGGGSEVYLRKNAAGQWIVVYQQGRWVS